jgi:acetyl-CoA C-acetyltransferase
MKPVYIVSAMRTAIGSFGGSLKEVPVTQLATTAIKSALAESKAPASSVGLLVLGNVIPSEPRDAYLSRVAALDAGIPKEATCFNVNRLCSSGLQAIVSAAQGIMTGDAEVAVAGGAESMSRGGYMTPSARWGARMGDVQVRHFFRP